MDRISVFLYMDVFFCLRVAGDISGGKRLKSGQTYQRQFTVFYVNSSHGHDYSTSYYCSDGSRGRAQGGGGHPHPLFSDHTDARRAEKNFWKTALPLISGSG